MIWGVYSKSKAMNGEVVFLSSFALNTIKVHREHCKQWAAWTIARNVKT